MSEPISISDVFNPFNFASSALRNGRSGNPNRVTGDRTGRVDNPGRAPQAQPAVQVTLSQSAQSAGTTEPAVRGGITPQEQLTQSLRTLTNPASAGGAGQAGGVVTIPVGLDPSGSLAGSRVISPTDPDASLETQLTINPRSTGSQRNVVLAASFAETALGNIPDARRDIIFSASKGPSADNALNLPETNSLGGNAPASSARISPSANQISPAINGRTQVQTPNAGLAFGPSARIADQVSNPGLTTFARQGDLNSTNEGLAGGRAIDFNIADLGSITTVAPTTPQAPREIAIPAREVPDNNAAIVPAAVRTDLDLGIELTPTLAAITPDEVADETLTDGQQPLAIDVDELTATPGLTATLDDDQPQVARSAAVTDLDLNSDFTPDLVAATATEVANETLTSGQQDLATAIDVDDLQEPPNITATFGGSETVAARTDFSTDLDLAQSNPTPTLQATLSPTEVAEETLTDGQNIVAANEAAATNTPEQVRTDGVRPVGGIVALTAETAGDAVVEGQTIIRGQPEPETPGFATSIARDTEEIDATRIPTAVLVDREARDATQSAPVVTELNETLPAAIPGGAIVADNAPADTNVLVPPQITAPEPVEIDDREPEATERANNPEIAPAARTDVPEPVPAQVNEVGETTALGAVITEPVAPLTIAALEDANPVDQVQLASRAVAAYEIQQLEARSPEPTDVVTLEESFIL